ncbi:hypothetical protein [Sphingopyxis sp. 113P3]|uniref:hypothetical protein n=1 Tax=Sphingopyxis sp. (strain 113P3) TaxID=292913 RepID=UPI0006AD3A59|nr:hypothetical protein [Sphingopyxis sp. 113P3]ALC11215.1 hypothetical protein LH20_04540 [Sphingopyxis sp. 113P3]
MYGRTLQRPKQRKSQIKKLPAPTAGWISNRALAVPNGPDGKAPQGAAVLDNFIPRATSVILRRGKRRHCTLGNGSEDATALFSYKDGQNRKLFGATETTIYDITDVEFATDAEISTEDGDLIEDGNGNVFGWSSTQFLSVMGAFTGGDWSVVQFAASGAIFLVGVNGKDTGFIYDGAVFYPYVAGGIQILAYDDEVEPFTIGETVTGGTSGATGIVWQIEETGSGEGILYIYGVENGPFVDDETLTDGDDGEATANGAEADYLPGIEFGTGITSADMSFVWVYKNRLYFVQKDTLDAWYLEVDSVGGAATKFPMSGIFGLGGSLLFGQRWSLSSGGDGGLSEQNAFVSTEGEVAIFQGLSPEDTTTWGQVGLYRVGRPLGKNAFIRGAGDIAIATSVGLVPLSKAIELDLTALTAASISYPVADAWGNAVEQRGLEAWHGEVWPEQKIAAFSPPTGGAGLPPVLFVANTETGAWSRFTGWDVRCMEVFEGRLLFGEPGGGVFIANETGSDDGVPYTGAVIPLFDDFGAPGARKIPKVGRYVTRASAMVAPRISWQGDYSETLPAAPNATELMGGSVWGQGIWGQSQWVESLPRFINDGWKSLGGTGYYGSLAYQVTSGSAQPLDDEIISAELTYEVTELL